MPHKNHQQLEKELKGAKKLVKIGGIYSHYKHPENLYKVIQIGIQEATDKICIIYQDQSNPLLIFVRDLDSWLEKPVVNNQEIERFELSKE